MDITKEEMERIVEKLIVKPITDKEMDLWEEPYINQLRYFPEDEITPSSEFGLRCIFEIRWLRAKLKEDHKEVIELTESLARVSIRADKDLAEIKSYYIAKVTKLENIVLSHENLIPTELQDLMEDNHD